MSDQSLDDDALDASDPTLEPTPIPEAAEPEAARPSLLARIGRRIVRRPVAWYERPWTAERLVQYFTALVVLAGCTVATLKVVHLGLVFTNNTPTGGDMGAHVMAPAYLRDVFLPKLQLSGWSNYWYNGFPLYRFYMVVPALMIVALNVIFPYGIAFKIVAVTGIISLPFCCWAFGRLARFRYPIPELMAIAGVVFLFDESFSIYGGNVKSTMAGEFSFSIALSLAMLGLGLFARGLETGKYRSWAAIVLALAALSHGLVALFLALALLLMWLVWMDRTRFRYGLTVGIATVLLSAFWMVPFLLNHTYMTDMKYGYRPNGGGDSFWDMFFPWPVFLDVVVSGFAVIGFVVSVAKRNLNGAWLGIMCLALMAATYVTRDSLPVIGLLWNPRLLPFLYLLRLLLMMVGIVETARFVVRGVTGREPTGRTEWVTGLATAGTVGLTIMVMLLFLFREVPGAEMTTKDGKSVYAWGIGGWDPITLTPSSTDALSDGWTRYNFRGYEGREYYGEYYDLVTQMKDIGNDPAHGCGEALWENNGDTGLYGTTMALMLLPHWTDGCITSSEGLFFEASGTTPYHFLTAAAMSQNSSNPVRGLRYVNNDASVGVPMLQKMGIRYVMVFTEAAKNQADARAELTLVSQVGPWNIYQVADSDVVVPLTVQPVVVNSRSGDQRERNLEVGTSWFQNPEEWAAMPADDGPDKWQRIDVTVDPSRTENDRVEVVVPTEEIQVVDLPEIEVTNVVRGDQDLSFDVSQVGVPVLVKMSYFPNWQVDGADGPYRVAPNFMVVVPTDTHVRLHFEPSKVDRFAYLLTLMGIVMLVVMRIRGDVRHRSPNPYLPPPMPAYAPPVAVDAAAPIAEATGSPPGDEWGELDWEDPDWAPRPGTTQSPDGPDEPPGSV